MIRNILLLVVVKNGMITDFSEWLAGVLAEFSCQTGTIHRTAEDGAHLSLVEQCGVPEFLHDKIRYIPFGKGIAGAAASTREPVELCNLQEDLGGVAKPDARKTAVAGSLAVPIFARDGSTVLGVLGIGMTCPHEFSEEEKAALMKKSALLCEEFSA
jgi:signal transduction protein with GAF and PtsI domain